MIYFILSVLDILISFSVLLNNVLPPLVLLIVAAYLIIKGGFFLFQKDLASIGDILVGIYSLAIYFGFNNPVLTIIAVIFLLQKGVFGLIPK